MSRHHNTKHRRGRSKYPQRLAKRGLSKAPTMTPYSPEILAAIHKREEQNASKPHPRPPKRLAAMAARRSDAA